MIFTQSCPATIVQELAMKFSHIRLLASFCNSRLLNRVTSDFETWAASSLVQQELSVCVDDTPSAVSTANIAYVVLTRGNMHNETSEQDTTVPNVIALSSYAAYYRTSKVVI